jgi:RNA polymerase sigma factor (sigma-70 family)
VEQVNKARGPAVLSSVSEQFEQIYKTEYPRLIRALRVVGATFEEAEDAAQMAMTDLYRRFEKVKTPGAYVRVAAVRSFVKDHMRDESRLLRELQGGYLVIEAQLDDQLTAWEEDEYVRHLLGCLTPAQREVFQLTMDGLSSSEIAEVLAKSNENVRQHLKNSRDRLRAQPEVARLASMHNRYPEQQGAGSTVTTPESRKEEVQ